MEENAENEARFNSWNDWIAYFKESVFKFGEESNVKTLNTTDNDNDPISITKRSGIQNRNAGLENVAIDLGA